MLSSNLSIIISLLVRCANGLLANIITYISFILRMNYLVLESRVLVQWSDRRTIVPDNQLSCQRALMDYVGSPTNHATRSVANYNQSDVTTIVRCASRRTHPPRIDESSARAPVAATLEYALSAIPVTNSSFRRWARSRVSASGWLTISIAYAYVRNARVAASSGYCFAHASRDVAFVRLVAMHYDGLP